MKDIIKRLERNKRGVSNVVVVVLSLVLIVIIVGNVILWSYQMNQLDLERIQEKVIITGVEQTTRSPWFGSQSEYAVNPGTRLDGNYSHTETVDNNSETLREEAILADCQDNPSVYSLVGSTRYGSGTAADLATENGVCMVFGSYPSNFSSQTLSPNEYTVDVELAGSSNTLNWQSLVWTIDSAFSTDDVSTTLQLYDYNTAQYPTGGDGYITYNSSSTPNADETKDQTISSNPTQYRNSTGEWKMRIVGVKDTTSPFDLKIDWVEFKSVTIDAYRLNVTSNLAIDLATYPLKSIRGIEITVRYNLTENSERLFLKAYNWTTSSFTVSGFNSTQGGQPVLNQWNDYSVNVTDGKWMDYVNSNGTVGVEFLDEGAVANQTIVGIDFFAVRAIIDGAKFAVKNSSPFTTHVVAVWIVNSANHRRYEANLFINSGQSVTYIRPDLELLDGDFIAKVVTERGNMAVFP